MISYSNLCSKVSEYERHCFPDLFLLSYTYLTLSQPVQYPIWHLSIYNTSQTIFMGTTYGGVHTAKHSGVIISARCVRMIFDFPPPYHITKFDDIWDSYVERNLKYPSNIRITKWSSSQYERDMKLIVERTRRLLPLLAFCLVSFCCLSSFKYGYNLRFMLISFYGVLSAAIGIDDMFMMLSIWEHAISSSSNAGIDRCDLIRITFRESIVSILLTTISNILVFTLGSLSPFPIIRTFCIYSAVSLFVVFFFQLTLFGSLLATKAPNSLCSSLISFSTQQSYSESSGETQSSIQSERFQSSLPLLYATIFKNKYFLTFICFTYIIYLIGSIIILNRKIDIGLQLSSLLPFDTGTYKYLKMYEEYFSQYNTPLEIVLPDELDYFDSHLQWRLFRAIAILENTNYTTKPTFWLPNSRNKNNTEGFVVNSTSFHENMIRFLQHPAYRRNAMHLIMNKVKIAEKHYSIRFLTYHVMYDLAEQDDLVPHLLFTNVLLAGMASICTILLLTPSVMNCILITWATFSINFGVFALLNVCGTHLDIISTIVILLSYSVDYSSHILAHFYHFKSHSKDPIGGTLSVVCWPVVQASGYIVRTFTHGVLFVCCIGLYHSIMVLPAFLSINAYGYKISFHFNSCRFYGPNCFFFGNINMSLKVNANSSHNKQ
uniref:SSD domain-containing protein n=1 Tax=Wuchereria bancrofti TaxID=6293 RepID=A0A1I8E9I4_WUCBA